MLQIVVGRIAQILLLVLTMRIATTLLAPAEMARVFLISSAVALYASLLLNPVGMFMNRRFHAWNTAGKVCYYYNYFWWYLLGISVIAAASLATLSIVSLLMFHTGLIWLVLLIFSSLLISTVNQVVIPGLNLLGHRTWFVYLTLATTAMSLVMAIFMVILAKPSAEYWIVGLLLGQLLIGFLGGKIFYNKINSPIRIVGTLSKVNNNHIRLMWKFTWPILISAGLIWTQTQSYRFIMENSLGLAALGLFVAGYGISAAIIAGFESVFTTYFQPIFYKHVSGEDITEQGRAWSNYASAILPSLLLVGFFVVAAAPELTRLLLGGGYSLSSKFVVWGAIAELARVANSVYGMVAHARMKTKILLLPNAIGVVVSITMILWLMPVYGATGVGFALALAGIAVFIATYLATRTELVTTLPYRTLIQSVAVGVALVVVATSARQLMGSEGIVAALMLLTLLSVIFLLAQYWILRPYLNGKMKNE